MKERRDVDEKNAGVNFPSHRELVKLHGSSFREQKADKEELSLRKISVLVLGDE